MIPQNALITESIKQNINSKNILLQCPIICEKVLFISEHAVTNFRSKLADDGKSVELSENVTFVYLMLLLLGMNTIMFLNAVSLILIAPTY